jgi:hypothetical protein
MLDRWVENHTVAAYQKRKVLKSKAQLIFDLIIQRIFMLLINQKLLLKG